MIHTYSSLASLASWNRFSKQLCCWSLAFDFKLAIPLPWAERALVHVCAHVCRYVHKCTCLSFVPIFTKCMNACFMFFTPILLRLGFKWHALAASHLSSFQWKTDVPRYRRERILLNCSGNSLKMIFETVLEAEKTQAHLNLSLHLKRHFRRGHYFGALFFLS